MSASLDCFSLFRCTHTALAQWLKGLQKLRFTFIPHCTRMCHLVVSAVPDLFDTSIQFFSFLVISLITLLSYCPTPSTSTMWWTGTLRTAAEDLGTLAENEPPTSYEPNEYHITEAYVDCTQESLTEQRFPDDFDYDDVTIGKTLLDACR